MADEIDLLGRPPLRKPLCQAPGTAVIAKSSLGRAQFPRVAGMVPGRVSVRVPTAISHSSLVASSEWVTLPAMPWDEPGAGSAEG